MSKRTVYRDPKTGRFISKAQAKRRRIRGKRVEFRPLPRDPHGRFVPLPRPKPLPPPTPTRPLVPEPLPFPADLEDELGEILESFPELDLLDELDELTADETEWYHEERWTKK